MSTNGEMETENIPWKGQLYLGTLWCLQQFSEITAPQISEIIKWNTTKIKDELRRIVESSILTFFIECSYNQKNVKVFSLDRRFMFCPLELLADLGRTMHDRKFRFDKIKEYKNSNKKPTKPEVEIKHVLSELQLNFIFNDDKRKKDKLKIGSRFPDFLDINGKLIIEVFGDYYHGYDFRSLNGDILSDQEHEIERMQYFSNHGYKTLIIWEKEVKDKEAVKEKISNFVKN
jgi:G:T-mismatch repair DNA endonuclease (very short patch repair protein)